jgi:transposase-like protein
MQLWYTGFMRGKHDPERKAEALRLRLEERLSIDQIAERTGAPKGSLSTWLRDHPLSFEERNARRHVGPRDSTLLARGSDSKFLNLAKADLTRQQKANVAEAAVLFRLTLCGLTPLQPCFEGDRFDWLVITPTGIKKLQVKWITLHSPCGLPSIRLWTMSRGKRYLYNAGDFDFLIGYWLQNDTAYVVHWSEVAGKSAVAVTPTMAERWDLLSVAPVT